MPCVLTHHEWYRAQVVVDHRRAHSGVTNASGGWDITREALVDALAEWLARWGAAAICSDNGPEFISDKVRPWVEQLKIEACYVAPGSPWENGYAKSFCSPLVDEFLKEELFESDAMARQRAVAWQANYNPFRPHSSLGNQTPVGFAARCAASDRPTACLK